MKPDYSPIYQPPTPRGPIGAIGIILSVITLAWLLVVLYGAAYALHYLVGNLL